MEDKAEWEGRRVAAWRRTQLALRESVLAEKAMREVHIVRMSDWHGDPVNAPSMFYVIAEPGPEVEVDCSKWPVASSPGVDTMRVKVIRGKDHRARCVYCLGIDNPPERPVEAPDSEKQF